MAGQRWQLARVVALAPDAASATAGHKLAASAVWSQTGCTDAAVWGAAKGSGRSPYYASVDLSGPAYKCSCPSRKIPCKHVLGLLIRWALGDLLESEPPEWVTSWLADRAQRAERAAKRAEAPAKPPDRVAQAKRAEQRADRVTGGLIELDRWLGDQIRGGLAQLQRSGYAAIDGISARMVDAQAPGVAGWLRGLSPLIVGEAKWSALLEEFALLRLLVRAHERLAEFDRSDPELAATVRAHVGYPLSKESVLSRDGVTDIWTVACVRDTLLDTLQQRTAYLSGTSGQTAVVLSFAAGAQPLDDSLVAGTSLDATLHFYPGAWPTRALLGRRGDDTPLVRPRPLTVAQAVGRVATAVAADPWVRSVPVWVLARPVPPGHGLLADEAVASGGSVTTRPRAMDEWLVVDQLGTALSVTWAGDPWMALAIGEGRPMPILLEWSPRGWSPVAAHAAEEALVPL